LRGGGGIAAAEADLASRLDPTSARPLLARTRPQAIFVSVDLPAPFGPSSPKIVPASTAKPSPSSARTPPGYVFLRFDASIAFTLSSHRVIV